MTGYAGRHTALRFLLCGFAAFQNLPESNPITMEETRKKKMMVLQALKDAAETNDNLVWSFSQRSK